MGLSEALRIEIIKLNIDFLFNLISEIFEVIERKYEIKALRESNPQV